MQPVGNSQDVLQLTSTINIFLSDVKTVFDFLNDLIKYDMKREILVNQKDEI